MKIKVHFCLLYFILSTFLSTASQKEFWVSPGGKDNNPGTKEAPLGSIRMAFRQARELRRLNDPSCSEGIEIILKGGIYQLEESLLIRPEDSGTPDSPTVLKAAENEFPILSGGISITNWVKVNGSVDGIPEVAKGKIWMADIPATGGHVPEFRQLWIDGVKAMRASTLNDGILNRILSVDKENEVIWIPLPVVQVKDVNRLEFVIHQWWAIAILRVKSIRIEGDRAAISFHQPESHIEFEHPWPAPFIDEKKDKNDNSAFWFSNAKEFLNQPGEWYEDLKAGKIYYWPKENQDMKKADVIVPLLENLVRVEGSADRQVRNMRFEGIGFSHTTWLRPSFSGHVPLQAGMYLLDAYKLTIPGTPDKKSLENQAWVGRQPAAIEVRNAGNLIFHRCTFTHTAATALDLVSGTSHNLVQGCTFTDIGGTAIQSGFFGNSDSEAHLPYNPVDEKVVCTNETIADNLIDNATNEDWGCVGIGIGYASNISIIHNEIRNVNYSGISLGWGWTKTINCMKNNLVHGNHIHHFARQMYDVGGIYTLSAQPNTEISENYINHLEKAPYAHDPNHYQYIYFDEGSSFIRAINNLTEKDKFFSNTPGPGNKWINNGPQVNDSIKENAGIRKEYHDILNNFK